MFSYIEMNFLQKTSDKANSSNTVPIIENIDGKDNEILK